jgi:hypothetical protein
MNTLLDKVPTRDGDVIIMTKASIGDAVNLLTYLAEEGG